MRTDARRQARFVQHQLQTQQNNTLIKRLWHVRRASVTTRLSRVGLLCAVSLSGSPRSMPTWSLVKAGPRLCLIHPWSRRCLSTSRPSPQASPSQQPPSRWGDTLLLPKTTFPLYNDPSKHPSVRAKTTEGLYQWQVGVYIRSSQRTN